MSKPTIRASRSRPISSRYIPKSPGLSAFTRTFMFDGKAAFTVSDRFTLKEPTVVEWRVQSDTSFEIASPGVYRSGQTGQTGQSAIEVVITEPKNAEVTRAVGKLKVPGPPGSITTGPEEARGHMLTATTKASGESRIEATIRIVR